MDNGDNLWNDIRGNWSEFKGEAKERWGELTDDELLQVEGKRDQLVGMIQKKYDLDLEEAEAQVDVWAESLGEDFEDDEDDEDELE